MYEPGISFVKLPDVIGMTSVVVGVGVGLIDGVEVDVSEGVDVGVGVGVFERVKCPLQS